MRLQPQGFISFVDDIGPPIYLSEQIVFYFALRRKQPALSPLELPEGGVVPTLRPYWDDVRRFDYEALFQAHELDTLLPVPASSQAALRQFIEELTTYDWADLREDVLGAVFEQLIPREEQILLGQFYTPFPVADVLVAMCVDPSRPVLDPAWRCCTARSKSLTSLCRLQSHPAQYVSGIPSAAILLSISHPIRCSTRCLANVRARISGPMIAL